MSYSKIKWPLYIVTILVIVGILYRQVIIEQFIKLYVTNEKFVISLSTTPHRIHEIKPVLDSLLAQKLQPDAIYLAIPHTFKRDNLAYEIPQWLQNDKRVTILRTEDYGPATKLLGTLHNAPLDPNTIVITVDDDIIYPANMTTHLVYAAKRFPNAAVGLSGANICYDENGLVTDKINEGLAPVYNNYMNVAVLRGFAGVAYRAKFFDDSVYNILTAPHECIIADDLYLSHHLALHNIQRKVVINKYISSLMLNQGYPLGHRNDALHNLTPTPAQKHRVCVSFMREQDPGVAF